MFSSITNTPDLLQSYTADLADCTPLSSQEERDLAIKIKQGDIDARNRLVVANLRFVMRIAKHYQNLGLPMGDLIGAGNVGLIRAAERFDEEKGFRFITYAVWWVRQAIQYTLAQQARTVRLPAGRTEMLRKIIQFANKQPRDNPEQEIAEAFDIPQDQVAEWLIDIQPILSLDTPSQNGDGLTLKDKLSDPIQHTPDASLLQNLLQDEIATILNQLDDRERNIICLYFGLEGAPQMTLAEIGQHIHLSRERVRQIKAHALRKLRHHPQLRNLMRDVDHN